MIARTLTLAALIAASTVTIAHAEEWFVVAAENETCEVVDTVLPGFGKLAGPYATEAEAEAELNRIARCDKVNTDPDPDEDGPAR
jgi:hypothetical protein